VDEHAQQQPAYAPGDCIVQVRTAALLCQWPDVLGCVFCSASTHHLAQPFFPGLICSFSPMFEVC
jgi:hypothetical protein